MKFFTIIAAAQLAAALPLAKDAEDTKACSGLDKCQLEGAGLPALPVKRTIVDDLGLGEKEKEEEKPEEKEEKEEKPSYYVTPSKEDYKDIPKETDDSTDELSSYDDLLSKRTLGDLFGMDDEDSYEETKPEVTSSAYEAKPTPSQGYEHAPKPSMAYEHVPEPSKAYGAVPTPSKEAYEHVPTPSQAYEHVPEPSKAYGAVPTPSMVHEYTKPSMVHEKPTPSFGSYESAPTPVKDTYESSPVEDSYEEGTEEKAEEETEGGDMF